MARKTSKAEDGQRLPQRAWLNFALLAGGGVALLAWIGWFTDGLKSAMVVVGIGGILTWPRSLVAWIPGVGDGLSDAVRRAMESRITTIGTGAVLGVGLLVSQILGGVAVRSLEPDSQRRLVFRPEGRLPSAQLFAGDSEVRRPFRTSWFQPLRVGVEVIGYPPTEVEILPWQRVRLIVPDDFRRPIILLRPKKALIQAVAGWRKDESLRVDLAVTLASEPAARKMDFTGRAVWIGCTADCDIPRRFAEEWENEPASLAWRWLTPGQLAGPLPRLAGGDRVTVEVFLNGKPQVRKNFTVRGGDEPQVEDVDVESKSP